ncbi:MAG: tRNA3(Ser)-specific nuclease WapA [Chlamydiae bacterium]|nr:tRNA3(Ser)-specific nuclease WapA [Chlamydiota bacterium]
MYFKGDCIPLFQRHYSAFHLLEEIDSEGSKTNYDYGPSGRLEQKTRDASITTYSYDSLGRCTQEKSLDYTLESIYDNLNRVIAKKEYSDSILLTQAQFTYDALSNILTRTTYPNNTKSSITYKYDHFGREIVKTDPFGETITTTYTLANLNSYRTIDEPQGITISETYDSLNQLIQTKKLHDGRVIAREDFAYDPVGNLISHATTIFRNDHLPSTHAVAYTYDSMHRKATETEQSVKTTQYSYTPKGQLSTLTKPNNTQLSYTYDPLGHLQSLISSDGTVDYSYSYNTKGQLLSSRDHIHDTQTARIVDPHGNILEETLANGYILTSTYDTLNRRTSLVLPHQPAILYTYEGFNLRTISQGPYTHTYAYDQEGNLISEETFNQAIRETTYDDLSRPIGYTSPHFNQTCTYDARGNIIQMEYRKKTRSYSYDAYDHLISEPDHHYTYDSLDNRLTKDDQSYTLNALNQIAGYEYDQNGNLIQHEGILYAYDALDRLIKVTTSERTIHYTYDSEHRRLNRDDENYLWDGDHELGTLDCYRILGSTENAEIGSAIAIIHDNTPYIPTHDLQGHLIHLADQSNNPVQSREFTAFGETFGPMSIPWGFCSKRHDPETDLIYFGRRYYDPILGRFITPDPEGYTDSYNLYAYCQNNPLIHHDPYGLFMGPYGMQTLDYKELTRAFFLSASETLVTTGATFLDLGAQASNLQANPVNAVQNPFQFPATEMAKNYFSQFKPTDPSFSYRVGSGLGIIAGEAALLALPASKFMRVPKVGSLAAKGATEIGIAAKSRPVLKLFQSKSAGNIENVVKKANENFVKTSRRNILKADLQAEGAHTVFRRNPINGEITHYESFRLQTNRFDPKLWESTKRFDRIGKGHINKATKKIVDTPHIHDPNCIGEIRIPEMWEIPN